MLKFKLADMDTDYDAALKIRRHLNASALKPIFAFFLEKVLGFRG